MLQRYKTQFLSLALAALFAPVLAQSPQQVFQSVAPPPNPKVQVSWSQYYDHAGINQICQKLAQAHPDLVRLETVGESYGGRRILALVVSDFRTGNPDRKPALYVDGTIRGNELQGAEVALYTAWFLAESFESNAFIQELLQQKTLYIIPAIYLDARDLFMHGGSAAQTYRTGLVPADDDGDGLVDEDRPEDINQDGHITLMRRRSAQGRYQTHPDNPNQLILAQPAEQGQYELLGEEGWDNDGDGQVNEDPYGYYAHNRDWARNWQPDYVQPGAFKYPFSVPENRNVKEFILRHPNIAGALDYIENQALQANLFEQKTALGFATDDDLFWEQLRQQAETLIPDYWLGLPAYVLEQGYGTKQGWFTGGRGILTFSLPLMSPYLAFYRRHGLGQEPDLEAYQLNNRLLFSDAFVEWTPFEHPTLGPVEIGGFKKHFLRENAGYLAEEEAHRNMVFAVYHAYQTPQLEIQELKTKLLPGGMTEVTATVTNTRLTPTHSRHDITHKIERPDYVILRDTNVVAGFVTEINGQKLNREQKNYPNKLELENIPGQSFVKVKWLVKSATPHLEVDVDSRKGGTVSRRF